MGFFESALEELDERRHRDIFRRLPRPRLRRPDRNDGFLPYKEAADVMGVCVAEAIDMGMRGQLEIDRERMLIRPAVVSTLAVREVS